MARESSLSEPEQLSLPNLATGLGRQKSVEWIATNTSSVPRLGM